MSELQLDHALTPASLASVNSKIQDALNDVDNRAEELFILIEERDELIAQILADSTEQEASLFAQSELQSQQALAQAIEPMHSKAKSEVTAFIKAKKAVKNYT